MPADPRPSNNLILAPIRGITDMVYRDAFAKCFGSIDRAIAPFIKLRMGKAFLPNEREQLLPANNTAMPVIPQVHTNHGLAFLYGLRELHDLGYDEVNWNLGCPFPMVAKRQRGAGLLPHPDRIDAVLEQVMADTPVKISAKIRLGYHSPDEVVPVLDVLNRYPLTEIILHPRIATQMYDGCVDIERAVDVFELCKHPFIYNGDIFTVEAFDAIQKKIPHASGWMVGRGALRNPFLPGLIKGQGEVPQNDFRQKLWEFHDELVVRYCDTSSTRGHVVKKMQGQWEYLAPLFEAETRIRKLLKGCRNWDAYGETVQWIQQQPLIIKNL